MYGRFPSPRRVWSRLLFEDRAALGGKAVVSETELSVDDAAMTLRFICCLITPANRPKAPIFLGLNFCGNHAVLDDERIRIPDCWMYDRQPGVVKNRATAAGRGKQKDVWPVDEILAAGFGLATIYGGDIEPDEKDVRGRLFRIRLRGRRSRRTLGPHRRLGVGAFAGGGLPCHSAGGRFITNRRRRAFTARENGAACRSVRRTDRARRGQPVRVRGAAPSRGTVGESVEKITTAFPAWFCGNFKKFNADPTKLPFDQHALVALCAPRPVLFTNAEEDSWANPKGQFEVLKAADPVYRLLNAGGCEAKEYPKHDELPTGKLGYFIRAGKHSMTRDDWKCYLHFAKLHLEKKP